MSRYKKHQTNMRSIFLKYSVVVVALGIFISTVSAAVVGSSFEAYGLDTVAGVNTYLRTSQTVANSSVVFDVKKPNGEIISVPSVTNANGVAQAEFTDYHTRVAGVYSLVAHFEDSSSITGVNTFEVLPGDVSVSKSTVSPVDQVVRSTADREELTVKLVDDYGNPISGHVVTLVSSVSDDVISPVSALTDEFGQVGFSALSQNSGTVTYTVYDSTVDLVLNDRAKVLYLLDGDSAFAENSLDPDEYFYAASGSGNLNVDSFGFSDVTSGIGIGDSTTFTVTAMDASKLKVTGYTGNIRFSVNGDNSFYANLPEDYTFLESDLGEHTFSLAASFLQEGTYSVSAQDVDSPAILGTYDFIVTASGSVASGSSINISNPVAGTYSNPIQVISGSAEPGVELKIFDNDFEISSLIVGLDGAFTFTSAVLADGSHSIYVASVNEIGTVVDMSNPVVFTVDTASPDVAQIVLEPSSNVDPGSVVTASINTGDTLSQATVVVGDTVYQMQPTLDGGYSASFAAPVEFGDYNIDLVLVDELGNETRVDAGALLSVGVFGNQATLLGDVSSLVVDPDDHRATLTWVAPPDSINAVKNYRVYYGLSPSQLSEAVDTLTNSNTWYIPNLKNGVTYYFAIVAVDESGNVSEHFSNIEAATPNPVIAAVLDPEVLIGTAGAEALEDMDADVSETGPEILWLFFCALIGGYFYNRSISRRALIKPICDSYEEIAAETRSINKKLRDSLFK